MPTEAYALCPMPMSTSSFARKAICPPQEKGRNRRRHSKFWIGLYGENWLIANDCCWEWIASMMSLVRNKHSFYRMGLRARKLIEQPL